MCPTSTAIQRTRQRSEFRLAIGLYYKAERERSEAVLGEIINILGNSDTEVQQVEKILTRLTEHYTREAQ